MQNIELGKKAEEQEYPNRLANRLRIHVFAKKKI